MVRPAAFRFARQQFEEPTSPDLNTTLSISTILRGTLILLIVLAFFGVAPIYDPYIVMQPARVWPGLEFWRMATYPLGSGFGGFIMGILAFSQPGEEVEIMIGKRRFGWLLVAVTLAVSLLYVLAFFGSIYPVLSGAHNISLFVMVGYVYLFPDSSIRIFFFNVRSKILLLLMVLLALGLTVFNVMDGASPLVLLGSGGGGLLFGTFWFHLVYQKYPVLLGPVRAVAGLFERGDRRGVPQSPNPIRRRNMRRQEEPKRDVLSDEERLDAILEKIGSRGYDSLTREERQFLDEYSSRL